MTAMAYNLLYGAYGDAADDGVPNNWRLYKDQAHSQPDFHNLPSSWASDIYIIDPSNSQWIRYIISKTQDAFAAFEFDGWHIDQLGDRGRLFNDAGQVVSLPDAFGPFIQETKNSLNSLLVMNAVNQFGQAEIAPAPVDFLYTEVWPPNDSYSSLVSIIIQNQTKSNGGLATVLAAYVNKGLSSQAGTFNTPAVLLADAVIFAAGGAHLELGEHMLANEYFPNDNLKMTHEQKITLIAYYDFLVAYQNLLRDGGEFSQEFVSSETGLSILNRARKGSVWSFAKELENRRVFHLINFVNATTLDWRDDEGVQPEPDLIQDFSVSFTSEKKVNSLWLASPDIRGGRPQSLTFSQQNEDVRIVIPGLKYWNMIVAEFEPTSFANDEPFAAPQSVMVTGNYPNPFNPETRIDFQVNKTMTVEIAIYNIAGKRAATPVNQIIPAGKHTLRWRPREDMTSGAYFVVLATESGERFVHKMMYLR